MRAYHPDYSQAALDALLESTPRQLSQVRAAIERLSRGFARDGDYQIRDGAGRVWEVKHFDNVVLTYWVDHAVCSVKIGLVEWVQ
ncbi:MAG: hypothetical protein JNL39_18330 [Opitutaceae bacterium]|nr:hypothetical protein [Opitutaceae bacterium]